MLKVLIFDIETAPIIAYVWGTRDQNIALNQIKEDWYLLAWAAKWLGDPPSKMMYMEQRGKAVGDDKALLMGIYGLLNEADIVITQNGTKFDSRKLNARFILAGMRPPKPYKHLDTYQILSRVADFTSDKLEYYADKINTRYKKLQHPKFAGMALWKACLADNPRAWAEMRRYNIHDVLATEELYIKVRAWTPQNAPSVHLTGCGVCGSKKLVRNGCQYSRGGKTQQYKCMSCGAWSRGKREAL